jgi:hypothetical protein
LKKKKKSKKKVDFEAEPVAENEEAEEQQEGTLKEGNKASGPKKN